MITAASWPVGALNSPTNGCVLENDTTHTLTDGERRWPVVEDIPFLRVGRDDLRRAACEALDRGDERAALVVLLRDQDDWAPDPPPDPDSIERLMDREPPLIEAMDLLGFNAVGDYFAYRLSDPTYLAGLALLGVCWNEPRSSFELACGVGHYSRELSRRGAVAAGGDVVFAKLWLARRYVASQARLVCFDAAYPFPVGDGAFDLAFCQDAFYFLPRKDHAAKELRRVCSDGPVAIGHAHNAAAPNHSSGAPLSVPEYAALLPGPLLYDDDDLTQTLVYGEPPIPRPAKKLVESEAVCLVSGTPPDELGVSKLALPPPGTPLYPNPLYEVSGGDPATLALRWPSARYRAEYAPRSGYLPDETRVPRAVLRRALSGGVGSDEEVDGLARRRVLVDAEECWR